MVWQAPLFVFLLGIADSSAHRLLNLDLECGSQLQALIIDQADEWLEKTRTLVDHLEKQIPKTETHPPMQDDFLLDFIERPGSFGPLCAPEDCMRLGSSFQSQGKFLWAAMMFRELAANQTEVSNRAASLPPLISSLRAYLEEVRSKKDLTIKDQENLQRALRLSFQFMEDLGDSFEQAADQMIMEIDPIHPQAKDEIKKILMANLRTKARARYEMALVLLDEEDYSKDAREEAKLRISEKLKDQSKKLAVLDGTH